MGKENIYRIAWNDHEALIRAKSNTNAREQAQMLYGRDALSWRMCPCRIATDADLCRIVRNGGHVFSYSLPLTPKRVLKAERVAYRGELRQRVSGLSNNKVS
jgi:hypothetical protein